MSLNLGKNMLHIAARSEVDAWKLLRHGCQCSRESRRALLSDSLALGTAWRYAARSALATIWWSWATLRRSQRPPQSLDKDDDNNDTNNTRSTTRALPSTRYTRHSFRVRKGRCSCS